MSTESSGTSARFQRLNDTNYAEWSLRMEAILIRGGLWGMIKPEIDQRKEDGTEKDASTIVLELEVALKARTVSKMNEARAEIILRLEDGQLSHCLRSNDPHVIWLVLESVHRAAGFATSLALRRNFLTLKKTPSNTMQAWIKLASQSAIRTRFLPSRWASLPPTMPSSSISTRHHQISSL